MISVTEILRSARSVTLWRKSSGTVSRYFQSQVATIEELARQVVAWEADIPAPEVATEQSERVASELVHTHLPKLAEATFIEYDPRSRTVRYTEPPALLDTVLKLLAELERKSDE